MNILQSLFHEVQKPETPLHVGEVMLIWTYYAAVTEARSMCELMLNHTSDADLKETIEHFIADVETPMIKKVRDLMTDEGLPFPSVSPDKPKTDEDAVPAGARMSDLEIAGMLTAKIEGLLILCHQGLLQSLRSDIAAMFYTFQSHLLPEGLNLKTLMEKRGWLRIPPYYHPNVLQPS